MLRRRKAGEARTGTPADWVVIGLANPGVEYHGTRHNVGGAAVEELARRLGATLRIESRLRARIAEVTTPAARLLLAVPTTYMNESGAAAVPLVRRGGIGQIDRLVVVHDELDLEPGRLQLKVGGGLAGHKGLQSIAGALGTEGFSRLRIGIGKPRSKAQGADWVLARPSAAVRAQLDESVMAAADVLDDVVTDGIAAAAAKLAGRHGG